MANQVINSKLQWRKTSNILQNPLIIPVMVVNRVNSFSADRYLSYRIYFTAAQMKYNSFLFFAPARSPLCDLVNKNISQAGFLNYIVFSRKEIKVSCKCFLGYRKCNINFLRRVLLREFRNFSPPPERRIHKYHIWPFHQLLPLPHKFTGITPGEKDMLTTLFSLALILHLMHHLYSVPLRPLFLPYQKLPDTDSTPQYASQQTFLSLSAPQTVAQKNLASIEFIDRRISVEIRKDFSIKGITINPYHKVRFPCRQEPCLILSHI